MAGVDGAETRVAEGGASNRGAYAEQEAQEAARPLPRPALFRRRIISLAIVGTAVLAGLLSRTDRVVGADGRLAPKQWAEIRADGPGEVRAQLKQWGDAVHAHDALAFLVSEGEEAAVAAAEGELAEARRQLDAVTRQLDRVAEYSVVLPPPTVIDLGAWLERELQSGAPAARLAAEATARAHSTRSELEARAARLHKGDARLEHAFESLLARSEAQILDALSRRSLPGLDQAMARYEDAIFEGLCDAARIAPSVVRNVLAGPPPADEGYFALEAQLRRAQLELRQLQAERTTLARPREVFPALAGEQHGERQALQQVLEQFVARSKQARRQREDGLGRDGEQLRAEIHRIGKQLLDGVEQAWARIGEGSVSGLGDLEHQVSQLRLGWNALEWALDRQLAAIASHHQGLIARNALEDRSASAEEQAGLFLGAVERLRISAEDLFGKRVGDVAVALAQKQGAVELVRARLRQTMAAAESQPLLETNRARYASSVARSEWALKLAKLALDAKVVRAPMDGVLTSVALPERTTLAKNEVVGVVEDLDGLVFKAMVPEADLATVAVGQKVRLSIEVDDRKQPAVGKVTWIGTGGLVVEKEQPPWNVLITVEGAEPSLMPALVGRAEIVVGRPSGIERLRGLWRSPPAPARRPLKREMPDPTRLVAHGVGGVEP